MSFAKAVSFCLCVLAGFSSGNPQDRGGNKPVDPTGMESVGSLLLKTDISCILRTWRLKGILGCLRDGVPRVCLWIENAYPCGIVEVVRKAGRTQILEAVPALAGLEALRLFGSTSSHTADSGSGTALQFAESRIFTFIPPFVDDFIGIPIAKPRGPLFEIDYVSELDGFGWRTGLSDLLTDPATFLKSALPSCAALPDPIRCAGVWGPWSPRIGFANHPSEVVGSALLGLRAGRVAERPIGRVVLSRYPFEPRTGHYLQVIQPRLRSCVPIGTPFIRPLEAGALSLAGSYLFIHFGIFEECKGCIPTRLAGPRIPVGGK
ncbi:MAG TPA: hypothetical protein VK661_12095 [Planctomycetota bacterium]|nr:hypothetical protein [Planctomycetota bacterium]